MGERRDEQAEAEAFLADPATHGGAAVERYDTHAAMVFVAGGAGGLAYKVKRAVRYPYLDFSTLALRRAATEHELELNRRATPELYLAVRPLVRGSEGGLAFGETAADAGRAVEWVLVMRAFDQEGLLDRVAARGALDETLVRQLAETVIEHHRDAPVVRPPTPNLGGAEGIAAVVAQNRLDFLARPQLFPPERHALLERESAAAIGRLRGLLDGRLAAGRVRHCHGDLHLRNICLIGGRPRLFDALEFDDAMASADQLYDFAFLLMDLEHRGLRDQANQLFDRYVLEMAEEAALGAMPLFLSVRSAIRAKVAAATEATREDEARKARDRAEARGYFEQALAYLRPAEACLVAVGGLSGCGKSSLARALAPHLGPAPGAYGIRSDLLRKRDQGVGETDPLPAEAYTPAANERIYGEMRARAETALAAGHAVLLDAVHARPEERAALAALAERLGLPLVGLWLEAPPETLIARVEARVGDASDADAAVVRQQLDYDIGPIDWVRIEAGRPLDRVAAEAREAVAARCPGALRDLPAG